MIEMSVSQYAGIAVTMLILIGISVLSGRSVHGSGDFQGTSRRSSTAVVMGAISGTIIGGSSTIGTAQLAYTYGVSACWYTLGSTVACLLFGLVYSRPLYAHSETTAPGIIQREFGHTAGLLASVINAGGMLTALIAQIISAVAVWAIVFPSMPRAGAMALTLALITAYVIFSGVRGVGLIGVFKLVLLYLAVCGGGCIAYWKMGGLRGILSEPVFRQGRFFDLLARGWSTDIGAGLSAVFGCLSSQSYIQAIWSGRTLACSRRGAVASALMIPPIGLGGVLIGLYMRANHPGLSSGTVALPYFLAANTPPVIGGVVLGAVLITVIGASAGIALGISSIISNHLIRVKDDRLGLRLSRMYIVLLLAAAACLSTGGLGDMILDYSFLGLGIRAVSCVIAVTAALFWPGKCGRRLMLATMIVGPAAIFVSDLLDCPVDPLMMGFAVSLSFLGAGMVLQRLSERRIRR